MFKGIVMKCGEEQLRGKKYPSDTIVLAESILGPLWNPLLTLGKPYFSKEICYAVHFRDFIEIQKNTKIERRFRTHFASKKV